MKTHEWKVETIEGHVLAEGKSKLSKAARIRVKVGDETFDIELYERSALAPLQGPHLMIRCTTDGLAVVPVASNTIALVKAPQ